MSVFIHFRHCGDNTDRLYLSNRLKTVNNVTGNTLICVLPRVGWVDRYCSLFINLDSFGVSCLVLEISAVEISAFSQI